MCGCLCSSTKVVDLMQNCEQPDYLQLRNKERLPRNEGASFFMPIWYPASCLAYSCGLISWSVYLWPLQSFALPLWYRKPVSMRTTSQGFWKNFSLPSLILQILDILRIIYDNSFHTIPILCVHTFISEQFYISKITCRILTNFGEF